MLKRGINKAEKANGARKRILRTCEKRPLLWIDEKLQKSTGEHSVAIVSK